MSEENKETHIEFWGKNPNMLFDPKYIMEIFPTSDMKYNQKLNTVSRLVILLTLVFYFVSRSIRVFIIGLLTLAAVWILEYTQHKEKKVRFKDEEGFQSGPALEFTRDKHIPNNIFAETTAENPLQNVMITDFDRASEKKPAPATYIPETQQEILEHTKNMIDDINPEQPKISKKLFRSLEDNLAFEQSMRPFYSNPSTTIPNDQKSFMDFCYGDMVSCKEGNPFACTRNLAARHTN